jgi:hypothetical protein
MQSYFSHILWSYHFIQIDFTYKLSNIHSTYGKTDKKLFEYYDVQSLMIFLYEKKYNLFYRI